MGEIQNIKPYVENDIGTTFEESKRLFNDPKWGIPQYNWDMDHAQQLTNMPINELDNHLKMLLGAKLTMEQLRNLFWSNIVGYQKIFKSSNKDLSERYARFAYLKRNPNKAAYEIEHAGKFLEPKKIEYNNYLPALAVTIVAIIFRFIFSKVYSYTSVTIYKLGIWGRRISDYLILIGIIFIIFAVFNWVFSRPIASLKNLFIRIRIRKILNADKDYCSKHDCSDETLKKDFKYEESKNAIVSNYVERMRLQNSAVDKSLNQYFEIVLEHIVYLPPEQTQSMTHLLKVYETLLNGVPTWDKAIIYVGQSEQMDKLGNNLTYAINHAAHTITEAIHNAQETISNGMSQMSGEMKSMNKNIGSLSEQTKIQSNKLDHWSEVQSSSIDYQTHMINQVNSKLVSNY